MRIKRQLVFHGHHITALARWRPQPPSASKFGIMVLHNGVRGAEVSSCLIHLGTCKFALSLEMNGNK